MKEQIDANQMNLYKALESQNTVLKNMVLDQKNMYSTDNQKVKYQSANITFYYSVNQILWWIYYFVILGVIYCILFGKAKDFSTSLKTVLVVIAVIFPYVIIPIETFLYWILTYFYSVMSKTVYYKSEFDMPAFTLTSYT
jgi:hypothetical protein